MPEQSVEISDIADAEENKTKSKIKVMLIPFFDERGNILSEIISLVQTINQQIYKQIL